MDLGSFNTSDYQNQILMLGQNIAGVTTNITKDFRLGFGSFETGSNGFKNHVKLSTDASRFEV